MLGPGVEPCEVGGPCTRALATLKLLSIPLVSLDIPSGMPGRGGHVRAWGTWGGGEACDLASGTLACLPTLSLSFPSGDGSSTLGRAEGHVHPSDGEDQGCCPDGLASPSPHTQPSMPAAHPGPVAQADVSSLSKGLAHPGRHPKPVGAIRPPPADGTNSCCQGVDGFMGTSPGLQDPRDISAGCHRVWGLLAMRRWAFWSEGGG